jgi:hypothetical protein
MMGISLDDIREEYVEVVYKIAELVEPSGSYDEYDILDEVVVISPGIEATPLDDDEVGYAVNMYVTDGVSVIFKGWAFGKVRGTMGITTKDGDGLLVCYDSDIDYNDVQDLFGDNLLGWSTVEIQHTSSQVNGSYMRSMRGF